MSPPSWTTSAGSLGTIYGGSTFSQQLVASAISPGSSLIFNIVSGTLPPGLSINSTGLISGSTSSVTSTIQYSFTIRATDNLGMISDRAFSITLQVKQPTWVTVPGNLGSFAALNTIIDIALMASPISPATTITYSLIAGNLPVGLELSSAGVISGTPAAIPYSTQYNFVVRATDNIGNLIDGAFSIEITAVSVPAFVTPAGLLLSTLDSEWVETAIQYTTALTDSTTIRIIEGQLPPGIEINEDGLLRGYPTPPLITVTTNTITTATISVENDVIVCYSTNGFEVGRPVIFSGTTISNITEGIVYYIHSIIDSTSFTISSTVGGSALTLTDATGYMVVTLPSVETGQPTIRTYSFTAMVENEVGSDTREFAIKVINQNTPVSIGGPNYLPNTRIPALLNTKPLSYDILSEPVIFRYYSFPGSMLSTTYPITAPAPIGKFESDNQFAFKLLGHDFDGDALEYEAVGLPLGLTLDLDTGWITGTPIIASDSISKFNFLAATKKKQQPSIKSDYYEFEFIISNQVFGEINWLTPSDLGIIFNNSDSLLKVAATSDVSLLYEIIDGSLPPNLSMLPNGEIIGTVAFQPTDTLLEKYEETVFSFTAKAFSPQYPIVTSTKQFTITVRQEFEFPIDILYIKCTPSIENRILIDSLLTDTTLIPDEVLFRSEDPNFGKSKNIVYEHLYGVNANNFDSYIAAVTKNHYWRNITLGEIRTAIARNQYTNEIEYEVVYSLVYDNLMNYAEDVRYKQTDIMYPEGRSIPKEIIWPRPIPLQIGGTTSILYPNSLDNMRKQIVEELGQEQNTDIFPLWMTSQQENGSTLGFVPAWVICYTKPGMAEAVKNNINANWKTETGKALSLNMINFKIDRFTVNKSQTYDYDPMTETWQNLPSAVPAPSPADSDDFYVWFPYQTILPE